MIAGCDREGSCEKAMTIQSISDYKKYLRQTVFDVDGFVRMVAKGKIREEGEQALPWRQVIVRPVQVKGERLLQFSYFSQKQDITKNYRDNEAATKLDELLALPFSSISAQSKSEIVQVQLTKKAMPLIHRTPVGTARESKDAIQHLDLAHDRLKQVALPANQPDSFLQATGIMNEQGQIRPGMHAKFAQINEFLKLLEHTEVLERFEGRATPVQMLDCGCGSAYLSFAAYHYLNDVLHIPAQLMGIDVNAGLIEKDMLLSRELGFAGACFATTSIIDYKPGTQPDIVLALHACDTATDEAIAQGITFQAQLILCAPCCHHHLHEQLRAVQPFAPVFQDGILRKRLGDILTDTFRALVLRILGYKTDVVEFIAPEHTDKNVMIRAVKRHTPGNADAVKEYLALKQFWSVTPYIETLLGEMLTKLLG